MDLATANSAAAVAYIQFRLDTCPNFYFFNQKLDTCPVEIWCKQRSSILNKYVWKLKYGTILKMKIIVLHWYRIFQCWFCLILSFYSFYIEPPMLEAWMHQWARLLYCVVKESFASIIYINPRRADAFSFRIGPYVSYHKCSIHTYISIE